MAKSIVNLLKKPSSWNKNYHLVSKENFSFNKFFEFSCLFGFQVEKIPYAVWRQKLIESHNVSENDWMKLIGIGRRKCVASGYFVV